jgi:hypothetical protein
LADRLGRAGARAGLEAARRLAAAGGIALVLLLGAPGAAAIAQPQELAAAYAREVDRRLELPMGEQALCAQLLTRALGDAGVAVSRAQFVVLVDRSRFVQAVMLWWIAPGQEALLVGASPASTGRPAGFEHFETPLGVFDHTLDNPDFRAEGTPNDLGICGYGARGMRVYDFGWAQARRGWARGEQLMRLQLHATDPQRLEPRLGERASKGCIRIPATLNTLIDRYGILDAAYDEAIAQGRHFWVLRDDRTATAWPGRYLVVIESQRRQRPAWSPAPRR